MSLTFGLVGLLVLVNDQVELGEVTCLELELFVVVLVAGNLHVAEAVVVGVGLVTVTVTLVEGLVIVTDASVVVAVD